ncbi:MAG TPA: CvpA family protein, partial [Tepidisphaeraceae bacterium]|nr:CvpA family protein [Tepidisphaeraceae bacterium]
AYFHYVQGFFSATLSAILTIISAAVAVSYQEPLVHMLQGKAGDQGTALSIVALFAVTYTILRVIFDKAVSGNIRMPVTLDKVGAGLAGIVAGVFAMGIMVIAAESLPFGPSIGGYTRYVLDDERSVEIPTSRRAEDSYVFNALKSDTLAPEDKKSLIIPVDDIVINLVSHLSDGGSLAGPVNMAQVHPAYLDELFGQRLGIQTGAKHSASEKDVQLGGLYTIDALPQADGEISAIRGTPDNFQPLKSDPSKIILIARLTFSRDASDSDGIIRFSTAAVRLVANQTNYLPIGTLDLSGTPVVRVNHPDDFLLVPAGGAVDFVFLISRDDLGVVGDKKNSSAPLEIGQNVFLEAKREATVDLSGQAIKRDVPTAPAETIKRKQNLPPPKALTSLIATPAAVAENVPFELSDIKVASDLFTPINVGSHENDSSNVTFASGTGTLHENKFARLEVQPMQTLTLLRQGDFPIQQLWSPPAQRIVQAIGSPPSRAESGWEWADNLAKFELIDSNGGSFKPHGAWAKIKQGISDRMVARYDSVLQVNDVPRSEGRPTDVWIAFLVPQNSTLREFRFNGKRIKALDQQV